MPIGVAIANGILNEAGKDIYGWLKSFKTTVTSKEYKQESNIEITFEDVEINSFSEEHEKFIELFKELDSLAKKINEIKILTEKQKFLFRSKKMMDGELN